MADPVVFSVILSFNRRSDTLECLEALARSGCANHKVLVLDNQSTDGSVEAVRANFPEAQIVCLEENRGYAGNNNIGIRMALEQGAEWVFLVNDDAVVDPDCLRVLLDAGESDPQVGAAGPLVYHYKEPDFIQTAGGILNRFWESKHIAQDEQDRGQVTQARNVDFISGCGILIRRAAIEAVGLMDENFYLYKEETDWCFRMRKRGWKILMEPRAKMRHKGAQRNHKPQPYVTYYMTRNYLLLLSKHRAPVPVRAAAWIQIARTLASWSLRPKWKHMGEHRDFMWQGVRDFIFRRFGKMRA